jgi:hypothetical protein
MRSTLTTRKILPPAAPPPRSPPSTPYLTWTEIITVLPPSRPLILLIV